MGADMPRRPSHTSQICSLQPPPTVSVFLHQTPPLHCSFRTQSLGNLRAATRTLASISPLQPPISAPPSTQPPPSGGVPSSRRPSKPRATPTPRLHTPSSPPSAAVLLAATSPALACAPTPTPAPATVDSVPKDEDSHPFEELIAETAALVRSGGADLARELRSSAAVDESCARLLAAHNLFVDGKVEEAIAAFEELARQDPSDYRPLFCQGVLYSALGRTEESASAIARCREVAGDKLNPDFSKVLSPADVAVADAEVGAEKPQAEEAQV